VKAIDLSRSGGMRSKESTMLLLGDLQRSRYCHVFVACCGEVQVAAVFNVLSAVYSRPPEVSPLGQQGSAVDIAGLRNYFIERCFQPAVRVI
jgi:hypothetical protein